MLSFLPPPTNPLYDDLFAPSTQEVCREMGVGVFIFPYAITPSRGSLGRVKRGR